MSRLSDTVTGLVRSQTLGAHTLRARVLAVTLPAAICVAAIASGGFPWFVAALTLLLAIGALWMARALNKLARDAAELASHAEALGQIEPGDRSTPEIDRLRRALDAIAARFAAMTRQLQRASYIDAATGLANHERFAIEIEAALHARTPGAVMVIVFSRLPRLLQTLTPETARELTRAVAARLTEAARPALVARISAVEFGVFAADADGAEAIRRAQHIVGAFGAPIEWRGHTFSLGAVCGVALLGKDGDVAPTVLRHARLALESAELAPARIACFTPALDRAVGQRLTLERELRAAIERGEFRPYFQPKVDLASGRIKGCEALARWIRPDQSLVSPARFIPVAEETGLIAPLSDAILSEACWKAAAWTRSGQPVKVAVNVSAVQFSDRRFAERVLRCLASAGLSPSLLELEITESTLMADPAATVRAIEPLREAGVRFAIDDFGCGHSSLAALAKLPFDVIKIDQQFVRALSQGEAHAEAIVEVILALGKTLGLETVAEGIERPEEAHFMRARGCDWAQGFLYSAAVPAPAFAELLARQGGGAASADAA